MKKLTAKDVMELLTSGVMEPTLVYWPDEDGYEVVPAPNFSDISWCDRDRRRIEIVSLAHLCSIGEWDTNNPTEEDSIGFADLLNDHIRSDPLHDQWDEPLE